MVFFCGFLGGWGRVSLLLFYLFLTVQVHFLKWDILRPQCHKRFTQCPLCNSCKTQTKLLLTPHAVSPPTKWNPRTTFGFWPITLEGDGDWKQYYESRSVIKSLLLGQRSGWGERVLCETTKDLYYVWIQDIYKRHRMNSAKATISPDLFWFNIRLLSWRVLLAVGKKRKKDGNIKFVTALTSARCDTQNPGVTESFSPQEKQGRWFVEGPRGASVPWKQVAQHHTAAYLQGIFVGIQEIRKNKTFSLQKKASATYGEVQWGD